MASNPAPQPDENPVVVAGVEIVLPIGDAAADLTPDVSNVGPVPPEGWTIQPNTAAGVYAFVPSGPPRTTVKVGSQPLVFVLEAVPVNRVPGPVAGLRVVEGTAGRPKFDATLTKFPSGWGSVQFWASPPDVDSGEPTTLHWAGPPGATYSIEYATSDGVVNLPPAGRKFANAAAWPGPGDPPLVPAATTVFTLNVSEQIDGTGYEAHIQATVSVVQPGPEIEEFAGTIAALPGGGYEVVLRWKALHTAYCTLSAVPAEELQPSSPPGGYPLPIARPFDETYVLEAVSESGATASRTLQAGWSVRSVTQLPAESDPPSGLALAPDGSVLYVAGAEPGGLAVYETPAAPGDPLPAPALLPMPWWGDMSVALTAAKSSPGQLVWAGWTDNRERSFVTVWEVSAGGTNELFGWMRDSGAAAGSAVPVAATRDGARVYTVTNGTCEAFDYVPPNGFSWQAQATGVTAVAASEDARLYLGTAGAVEVMAISDAGPVHLAPDGVLPLPGQTVADVAVGGDALFVALGQEVVLADRHTAEQVGAPIPIAADRLAVSADGLRLYVLTIATNTVHVLSPDPV